jgi:hypothetical protein
LKFYVAFRSDNESFAPDGQTNSKGSNPAPARNRDMNRDSCRNRAIIGTKKSNSLLAPYFLKHD